jgi:2-phosphoglycerate kinase
MITESPLKTYRYCKLDLEGDLDIYKALKERMLSICLLLGGTSGCGKSTVGSLLASRLAISTVISTDHLRHVLRSYSDVKTTPILFTSSYHAGETLEKGTLMSVKEQVRTPRGYHVLYS